MPDLKNVYKNMYYESNKDTKPVGFTSKIIASVLYWIISDNVEKAKSEFQNDPSVKKAIDNMDVMYKDLVIKIEKAEQARRNRQSS